MILQGGLPSLARQGLASIATISLNHAAGPYGDAVIAAMGVVQRVTHFGASTMIGFGQGFQPVCGFNYGAGLVGRVKQAFWFCVKLGTVLLVVASAAGFIFAPELVSLFSRDGEVIRQGTLTLRLQCISFPLTAWFAMATMLMQTIGRVVPASFLSMARQGLFFIPLILWLPRLWGVAGVQFAQALADGATFVLSAPFLVYFFRKAVDNKSGKV
jgi:Na+-driven multidrug efflux pump